MPFNHSVKVPRKYKLAANILTQVGEGGSLKTLLFQDKYKHWPLNAIYALTSETLKHDAFLNRLFIELKLFESQPRFDPWLAKVLMVELLFGKKDLLRGSKPVDVVLSYHDKAKTLMHQLNIDVDANEKQGLKPRYIRVNTLKIAIADAIQSLQECGWRFVRCTGGSYDDYLEQIKKLTCDDFLQDYHVKTVFAFAPKTQLQDDPLYIEKKILLQDKATCLAATFLAPTPGSTILDLCAAPGMKTTHLAALIKNQGTIYAVEKDEERYKTLCKFIDETGSTCVKPINEDAYKINKDICPNVEFILVDPSCSGSGMLRPEAISDVDVNMGNRLKKLSSMQAKLLKHSLFAFPNAKRVVYSTCSLHPEENENVVNELANHRKSKFQLVSAKSILNGKWNNTGDTSYINVGDKCLYAKPDSDLTTGVFVAVFQRVPEDFKECQTISDEDKVILDSASSDIVKENIENSQNKHLKSNINDYLNDEINKEDVTKMTMNTHKMKKNKHRNIKSSFNENLQDTSISLVYEENFTKVSKKKSKKCKRSHCENDVDEVGTSNKVFDNILEERDISISTVVSQGHSHKRQKPNNLGEHNIDDYNIKTSLDINCKIEPKMKHLKKKKMQGEISFGDTSAIQSDYETSLNKVALESISDIPKNNEKNNSADLNVINSSYDNAEELCLPESDQTKKKRKKSKKDKKSFDANDNDSIIIPKDDYSDEKKRKKLKKSKLAKDSAEYENMITACTILKDDVPVTEDLQDITMVKRKKNKKSKR